MIDFSKLDISFIAGTLGQGGAERQLFYIIKTLKAQGACVRLLCLTQEEFWEKKIKDLGVEVTWVGQRHSRVWRLRQIIEVLKKNRSRIVQSQHFYTNLYAALAARALGVREIGAVRSNGFSEIKVNGAILGQLSLRLPRLIAANSQVAIKNSIAMGIDASHLHLLPNVVDTDQFKPATPREKGHLQLLLVGRLGEEKRIDRFLIVLHRLRKELGVKLRGLIVGDGPMKGQLEQQAFDLGLIPDVVEFRGAVSNMAAVYQEADVLVLTSDWEGTPNVVLEAMASGLPVVATPVGGVPDMIKENETGKVAGAVDVDSVFESLKLLLSNPELLKVMGQQAREYVSANHSPDFLNTTLSALYEKALS
jgi:glycosyltransferase involved in cell wall biosynthesis